MRRRDIIAGLLVAAAVEYAAALDAAGIQGIAS